MTQTPRKQRRPEETRKRLVAAAQDLVLERGFSASGVDQICERAGVTKGAFFHHFKSKDEIGIAALGAWAEFGMAIYAEARKAPANPPLARVHRFFDLMTGIMNDSPSPVTCVVGMMSQELAQANPVLRDVCSGYLGDWSEFARELLEEAKAAKKPQVDFNAADAAWFLNALWQGSMLVAKTRQEPRIVIRNLEQARAFIDSLFSGSAALPPRKTPRNRTKRRTKQ